MQKSRIIAARKRWSLRLLMMAVVLVSMARPATAWADDTEDEGSPTQQLSQTAPETGMPTIHKVVLAYPEIELVREQGEQLVVLSPGPEETVIDRTPLITADLKKLGTVDPSSIVMRIGGLGTVPAVYDSSTMTVRFKFPYRLRHEECVVSLSFKRAPDQPAEVLTWRFKIDLKAAYLPEKD